MDELTTRELLAEMSARGIPHSQKLLVDLARRGIVEQPVRRRRREGGHGTESYWPVAVIDRLATVAALREEGLSYTTIMDRLGVESPKARRLSITAWMATSKADRLEAVSKRTRTPVVVLLQQGARLYHEAAPPVREFLDDVHRFEGAVADGNAPSTDGTFTMWADVAVRYHEMLADLLAGREAVLADAATDGYLFWHIIQDGRLPEHLQLALQVAHEDVLKNGELVGHLTTFAGRLRLLRPLGRMVGDLTASEALARELGAVLVAADGRDYSAANAAKSLAAVGDWLRERTTHGK